MDEYIERSAGVSILRAKANMAVLMGAAPYFEKAAQMLEKLPVADVAPVVHGRWSDAGFGELPKHAPYGWACSVCGGISFNNEYIYCPHCGAKMDGGDNIER